MQNTEDFASHNILSTFYANKGETKTEKYRKRTDAASAIITEKFFKESAKDNFVKEAEKINQEQA